MALTFTRKYANVASVAYAGELTFTSSLKHGAVQVSGAFSWLQHNPTYV